MAFTKKRSRYVAGRAFGRDPGKKGVFRRRPRRGLFASLALALLLLSGIGAAAVSGAPPSGSNDGPVQRVDAPAVAGAPEPVVDLEAREEAERARAEKAAEEQAAKEEAAEKEAAAPPAPEDPTMYLTVPRLGVYGHTVRNDDSQRALDLGAIKVPETGFPWEKPSTNTYIAGHRVGWPGTESHYQFYNLPAMQEGDEVVLEDTNGAVYTYRVTEIFAVHPWETRVTRPIPGRDVVSLQTCTESVDDWWTLGPDLYSGGPESGRLVVRADRVG
ncbi:sortase (plasmid) [Rubrobacter tropicus]|uniref:Sortase n=1 Tax=Rubrobacter tropicus TaxID=2653851 RepID=A0A6G8QGN6_9ACTN|nr:class E sortase [Rubrobacter tropicus]QIN85387.1 sortase [Rubrobacter tropicus]